MALIHPRMLKTVVALGALGEDGKFLPTGTGFFFAFRETIDAERGETTDWLFVVTNRHVVEGGESLSVRINREPETASPPTLLSLGEAASWIFHPRGADVAAHVVSLPWIQQSGVQDQIFLWPYNALFVSEMKKHGLSEGDGVFLLGFPLGLVGEERNYVIVKQGGIARIQDLLAGNANTFLVDALAFPGNSGGPVLNVPNTAAVDGTQSLNLSRLIGMVTSYVPYREAAISEQTKQPRVIFEENSGLAHVVPVDDIYATAQEAVKLMRHQIQMGSQSASDPAG